tara:strand:- start:370 stop:522 length:153 start_codon:yes stop_codon:yes gene_type:complete
VGGGGMKSVGQRSQHRPPPKPVPEVLKRMVFKPGSFNVDHALGIVAAPAV